MGKPASMKKTSQSPKKNTPKKEITKTKKDQKKSKEKKIVQARQSKSQEKKIKKRRSKAEKDPDRQKKLFTESFIFMADKRDSIKKNNPEFTNKEIISEFGKRWKALTDSQKKPYASKSNDLKAGYEKEMEKYKKRLANKSSKKSSQTKSPKKSLKKAK